MEKTIERNARKIEKTIERNARKIGRGVAAPALAKFRKGDMNINELFSLYGLYECTECEAFQVAECDIQNGEHTLTFDCGHVRSGVAGYEE